MASPYDDDDDGWTEMPVIQPVISSFDVEDRAKYHYNPSQHLPSTSSTSSAFNGAASSSNATGRTIVDAAGHDFREKDQLDEMDYTRLELDDDPEEDEISMRTQYLFNEEKGMTPLSQMQTTKTLLTEGQRIAYVGVCRLVAREMVQTLAICAKGSKELEPARDSAKNWSNKIMGRLYRHMEVNSAEQKMIEQLAEHGVTADDLVPSLLATYTVDNPEYDPEAAAESASHGLTTVQSAEALPPYSSPSDATSAEIDDKGKGASTPALDEKRGGRVEQEVAKIDERERILSISRRQSTNPFGDSETDITLPPSPARPSRPSVATSRIPIDPFDDFGGGDIGGSFDAPSPSVPKGSPPTTLDVSLPINSVSKISEEPTTPRAKPAPLLPSPPSAPSQPPNHDLDTPLPSSLPGVSTTITAVDKTITLDIRWTILCDLFLSLIADSVYDARSRVLMGKIADRLGLEWMDVVRFERRLTEALEIQEGVQQKEHSEVLEEQRLKGKKARYVMMGLATLGGGLVIGLSAGLLAPVIGAGLGAALTTVGVTGTTGFLAGAGGAAIISSGATITGSVIGGKAMAKRTRHVKTFEFQPLHNNKRVNFYITVPGFMNGPLDDVRLPFSTIDPVMGDVFSVLWEPDMMGDTGNALKILTTEVFTQVGQQVLAATVMTALLSALQWPLMLTKLGYLIDNPWSNALDRAKQAGLVLADILIHRHMGVRPVSLVGFSLGARVIFYALVELAKVKAFGVVQDVFLFGATLTAPKKVWHSVRGVVSGRFVNAFAMNDWVLGYLFRATSGGLNTVAGLRPIDHVPDLENVDITDLLSGHMSYRTLMPTLLAHVGFKTTADHFDEPEDGEHDAPDREVLTKEEEEKRKAKKEKAKLGIFGRQRKSRDSTLTGKKSPEVPETDLDDDDLPPRMDASVTHSRSESNLSGPADREEEPVLEEKKEPELQKQDEGEVHTPISRDSISGDSPGFDLAKLRQELSQLPQSPTLNDDTSIEPERIVPTPLPEETPVALDAREILRRQWAGESTPSSPSSSMNTTTADDWATNPFAMSTTSFSSPEAEARPSFTERPSFTFATADGDFGWSHDGLAESKKSLDDEAPDPAPAFIWGSSNISAANRSNQNPW